MTTAVERDRVLALQALLRQHWRPGSMPCVSTGAGSVGLPRLHAPGGDARVWSESDSDAVVQLVELSAREWV